MARIAVFNQKGGVGKTTASLNLSAALARRGRRPLSIDLDPQAHLSSICGVSADAPADSLLALYESNRALASLIRIGRGGWEVIPAHGELSKVDSHFGKGPQALNRLNAAIVRENLNTGRPIVMDCCPLLGVLSLNAIFAADRVLVPVSADWLAVKGVLQVEKTLRALEVVLKRRLPRASATRSAARASRSRSAWPRARRRTRTCSRTRRQAAAPPTTTRWCANSNAPDSSTENL